MLESWAKTAGELRAQGVASAHGKVHEQIDRASGRLAHRAALFVVATATLSGDGLINASPKGGSGVRGAGADHEGRHLDLTGSGVEAIAHLENGRIVLMFMAISRPAPDRSPADAAPCCRGSRVH